MIDYEKLKIAHDLAKNSLCHYMVHTCSEDGHKFVLGHWSQDPDEEFETIDDLIQKLQELTNAERKPKYEMGQKVWLASDDRIFSYIIEKIIFDGKNWIYEDTSWSIYENSLHPSKQSLIESQIEYWTKLKTDAQINQI